MEFRSLIPAAASALVLLISSISTTVFARSLSNAADSMKTKSLDNVMGGHSPQLDGRGAVAVGAFAATAAVVASNILTECNEKARNARSNFTINAVEEARKALPHFNWLIVHTKHIKRFEGQRGIDWDHIHYEFDNVIVGTVGYEMYYFRDGEFTLQGDGGLSNWAYSGTIKTKDEDGRHIIFSNPKGSIYGVQMGYRGPTQTSISQK